MRRSSYALAVALIALTTLTGCTLWGSVTLGPPPSVAVHYSGPDWVPGAQEAAHEPTATPYAAPSPTSEPWQPVCVGTVTAATLNVRAEPVLWATVRTQVHAGDRVEIIGSGGDWLEIRRPPGWVSGIYVRQECAGLTP